MAQLAGIYFCSSNSGTSTLTPSEAVQGLLEKVHENRTSDTLMGLA